MVINFQAPPTTAPTKKKKRANLTVLPTNSKSFWIETYENHLYFASEKLSAESLVELVS